MTVNAITDTKKGRTGIAPTYLHTTRCVFYADVLKYILTNASARRKPAVRGVQLKQRATLSPHTLLSMS